MAVHASTGRHWPWRRQVRARSVQTEDIDHMRLVVNDLERARRFFVERLGWQVVGEAPGYRSAWVSDGRIRLNLWQVDRSEGDVSPDRHENVGLHHVALEVPGAATLESIYAHALTWPEAKIEFAPRRVDSGPRVHCMMCEPGGIRVELVFTLAT